jgi:prepilin-type N-terminal cleavage/methylation domain-containing protein
MRLPNAAPSRAGFTLLEILVALALIGLLAGALVPTVLNQLGKGESNRFVEDLRSVGEATKSFRTDVSRWPGGLSQLVQTPASGATDVQGNVIPAVALTRWSGPYLERSSLQSGGTLTTAAGANIQANFQPVSWRGTPYLAIRVAGVTQAQARAVSLIVDGDTAVGNSTSPDDSTAVSLRGDTLIYLVAPVN